MAATKKIVYSHPKFMPPKLDYNNFIKELTEAQKAISILHGAQRQYEGKDYLMGPLLVQEATMSSRIEGTQSSSSDVYMYSAGGPSKPDTPVVSNYREAAYSAIGHLRDKRGVTPHLIKSLHHILLSGVRYKGVLGNFRHNDVWIAPNDGDPIEKAIYIPPEHVHLPGYIEDMLKYLNEGEHVPLIRAGILHYQFEAVHPFEDGNGRIGRLLIPIELYHLGELNYPTIYSSGYFEARAIEYRRALRTVDRTGEYDVWLKYFFKAISEQAKETLELLDKLQKLNHSLKEQYRTLKLIYLNDFADFLIRYPVFTVPMLTRELSIDRITASRLLKPLLNDGKLVSPRDLTGRWGSKLYVYDSLLSLLK